MAMTPNQLDSLCETGFGPISVSKAAGAGEYEASIAGDKVGINLDGPALRLVASSAARWPSGPSDQVESRVRFALDGLLLGRGDLAEIDATAGRNQVTARLWLDAATTNAGTLAAAVQATRLLARAASTMLDSVEEEMRAEEAWIASRPGPVPLPDEPAAPAEAAPAPSAPAAEAPAVQAPPPAAPAAQPTWVYVDQPIPIYDLANTHAVVGSAQPGTWYRLEREESGWAHLTDPGSGLTGWADAGAVRRQ